MENKSVGASEFWWRAIAVAFTKLMSEKSPILYTICTIPGFEIYVGELGINNYATNGFRDFSATATSLGRYCLIRVLRRHTCPILCFPTFDRSNIGEDSKVSNYNTVSSTQAWFGWGPGLPSLDIYAYYVSEMRQCSTVLSPQP